jgi:hypothetical protein
MDSITVSFAEQRVGPMAALPTMLREGGIDPASTAAAGPISVDDLADPTARVSSYDLARVLKAALAATGCPHLGLLIGQRCDFTRLGLPGQLALSAPDVETGHRGGIAGLAIVAAIHFFALIPIFAFRHFSRVLGLRRLRAMLLGGAASAVATDRGPIRASDAET